MSAPDLPRGLPGPLPEGERILWQGAPTVWGGSARIFHLPLVAGWLALVALVLVVASHGGLGVGLGNAAPTLLLGSLALLLLTLFGWLVHRTTTYTITDRRVVMRIGIALPVALNLPYAQIDEAGLRRFADGSGDLPLRLRAGERVAYLHLWPHVRPWVLNEPQPMLRSVPDADAVASLLSRALAAHAGQAPAELAALPLVVARPRAVDAAASLPTGAH